MSVSQPCHRGRAFGLTFASEFPLPELLPAGDEVAPDVVVRAGAVPDELPGVLKRGVRYQAAAGALRLQVDGVGTYLIEDGQRITIALAPGADEADMRLFLLGSAVGALLHQRGDLVLHGSAVEWNGEAVVFLGLSGVGKSTLATAFKLRGRPMLTDDLCVVRPRADGRMMAQPGFPQAKLWLDSLRRFELAPEGLKPIRVKIDKRALPLADQFPISPLPVRRLYVLSSHNKEGFELTPGTGPQKFNVIKNHTYRFSYIADINRKAGHFQHGMQLAAQVSLARVIRPAAGFRLEELVQLIESDLAE